MTAVQRLQIQVVRATLSCSGDWLPMELGHPPSGSLWSLLVLTEPAPQADGFPAALEVRLQDEPGAQQGEEQHHEADHTCRGGRAAG